MESPLFLFGYDRSGTTLLSMVIGAHRDIAVPFSATGLWYRYGDRLDDFNALATPADRDRLVAALLAEERIALWNADLAAEDIRFDRESASYADIVAAFHAAYARKQGKPRWGNIDISTLDELPRVNAWFPKARFVHIVRDGRDIALSHQTMPYGAGNIAE
ncbi:MAG: sulfotransferase, partial [Gammaproteobacteria bacterium]|nr:sulfotransferase [Gammaproteobacteria bacterium]